MSDSDRAELSEPDLSDDDMGAGLHGETLEKINRIVIDASTDNENAGSNAPESQDPNAPNPPEQPTDKRKTREPTSDVWKYFKRGPKEADGSFYGICNYCGRKYKQGNQRSTSSMRHHIKQGCKKMPRGKRLKIDAMQKLLNLGSGTAGEVVPAVWEFNQANCRKKFARMVIAHEYPFNCATHHFLKDFCNEMQPCFKMLSRNTVRLDCLSIYEEERIKLYELFGKLDCRFSFTSDLWTNKGKDRGFCSLTCHYIDDSWKLRKIIINFTNLPCPHDAEHLSQAIYEKLVMWNLDKRAFCLVLDNCATNDASIRVMFTNTPIKQDLPANGSIFHQRCGAHILNLIVGDGLAVLHGEINKVRLTMKYIRNSQGRMEKFNLAAAQVKAPNKRPAWDVTTRWNSTYIMLELALQLRPAINRYAQLDKKYNLCPSEQDWNNVHALVDCLKVFFDATKKFSGSKYPTLNLFFPEFCEVYLNIMKMCRSPHTFIVQMGKEMFVKWNKYWTHGNTLLAIATVLDPRYKTTVVEYYFERMNPDEGSVFVANMRTCMDSLFRAYKEAHLRSLNQTGSSRQNASASDFIRDTESRAGLKDFVKARKVSEPVKSEIDQYLDDPLDEASVDTDFDILGWWKANAPKYPIMARLTRDILAVPISTVASESTFSTSGRILNPVRNSLNDDSMEALVCTQDWLRASVTENGGDFGAPLWPDEEEDEISGSET